MIDINPRIYLPATHTIEWRCPRCHTHNVATIEDVDVTHCPECDEPWLTDAEDRRENEREVA